MGKSKKRYKKCTANKPAIKKPKIVYTLDDIIFKNCDELERYKKLKAHTHFLEIINETTVRCVCNKEVKLDRSYRAHNLDSHSKGSLCNFTVTKQLTLNFFWKNQKSNEQRPSELPRASVACSGLTDEKYHNYILLSPSQYGGGRRPDIVAYELFPEKFPNQKNYSWRVLNDNQKTILKRNLFAYYQWRIDKDLVAIFSIKCLNFTTNESGICDECLALTDNLRLKDAINAVNICNIIC